MDDKKADVVNIESKRPVIYSSIDQMVDDGATVVEYAVVDGFKPGTQIRIGSVTAGDMIVWSEGNEAGGELKRTAGLRLICQSLVTSEEEGNRRYACGTPAIEQANIAKMRTMRHKETERVVKEILTLNGMTVKQDKDAKNG